MSLRVKCPRCGKYWTARQGDSDVQCTCHLYCPEGEKPSDCAITSVTPSGTNNWPRGLHLGFSDDRDNEKAIDYYCSVHDYYFFKAPVLIEVDWTKLGDRARKAERYWGGGVTA